MPGPSASAAVSRRRFLQVSAATATLATPAFTRAIVAAAPADGELTLEMVRAAEAIAGLTFTDAERAAVLEDLAPLVRRWQGGREAIPNGVGPSFGPSWPVVAPDTRPTRPFLDSGGRPAAVPDDTDLAFSSIAELAALLRAGLVTSEHLTRLSLRRLRRYDPKLACVITTTEDRALERARRADDELRAGHVRSALHGVPWGAKDIISARGYRTTWGAKPFENQMLDEDATVVERLDEAGAVLVAKLTVGALAMGDVWFGGRTKNPWRPDQGSSGSSAGPAAAVAAGLVPFSIGTETLGSIVSPSTRCGTTGLRPTFGRVSRHGVMALVWSMDKVGPIARSVRDCELVLEAVAGPDGRDPHLAADAAYDPWPRRRLEEIRVGYVDGAFGRAGRDADTLEELRELGLELVPVHLPEWRPELMQVLEVEAAAAFDEITRDGRVRELVRQDRGSWPRTFRKAQLVPAVEYVQASRRRTQLAREMEEAMADVDVFVSPTFRGGTLRITNFTGHPCVCLPNGFARKTPRSITFIGRLMGERELITVAAAYQDATGFHRERPPIGRE